MLWDREVVISSDAGLAKISIGDFPLMRMASGFPAICPRFRGDFTHGGVSDHREIPRHLIRLAASRPDRFAPHESQRVRQQETLPRRGSGMEAQACSCP